MFDYCLISYFLPRRQSITSEKWQTQQQRLVLCFLQNMKYIYLNNWYKQTTSWQQRANIKDTRSALWVRLISIIYCAWYNAQLRLCNKDAIHTNCAEIVFKFAPKSSCEQIVVKRAFKKICWFQSMVLIVDWKSFVSNVSCLKFSS